MASSGPVVGLVAEMLCVVAALPCYAAEAGEPVARHVSPPSGLIPAGAGVFEVAKSFAYFKPASDGRLYMFAVDRELRHRETMDWSRTPTFFGSEEPVMFLWLDSRYAMQKALQLETGEFRTGERFEFEVVPDVARAPYGLVRVALLDERDRAVATREFRTVLVPVPSPDCALRNTRPWRVNGHAQGEISFWDCNSADGATSQIAGIYAERETVFQTWSVGDRTFAAITLDDRQRVVAEVYDTLSMIHFDEQENTAVLRLYVNGTLYERVIRLRGDAAGEASVGSPERLSKTR